MLVKYKTMADENIYEKIDDGNIYEKPFSASVEKPRDAGTGGTEAVYSEIEVQGKATREPVYINTDETTSNTYEIPTEEQNGVSESPTTADAEVGMFSRTVSSPTGEGLEPPSDEPEDDAEDDLVMAYKLPKSRSVEAEDEVVDYSLKSVQNNNAEEEKAVDPNLPEISLFVKVGSTICFTSKHSQC